MPGEKPHNESFEPSPQDQSNGPEIKKIHDGDTIFISGDAALALKIIAELDPSEGLRIKKRENQYIKDLNEGIEFRPLGVFSVRLEGNKITVQNRNGRGDEEYREQMRIAVEDAFI